MILIKCFKDAIGSQLHELSEHGDTVVFDQVE